MKESTRKFCQQEIYKSRADLASVKPRVIPGDKGNHPQYSNTEMIAMAIARSLSVIAEVLLDNKEITNDNGTH